MPEAIVSADAHCLEPEDLWTSRLSKPEWVERAPTTKHLPGHMKDMRFDGKRFNLSIDYRRYKNPGHLEDGVWEWSPEDSEYEEIRYDDVNERHTDMDSDGVTAELIHPNNGQLILGTDDVEFSMACSRIYNDYVAERLKTVRCYPNAIIPVDDVKLAVGEIDRVASLGLQGIELPLLAPPGLPYILSRYDPIWSAAQANGLAISLHVGSGQLRAGNFLAGGQAMPEAPAGDLSDEEQQRGARTTKSLMGAFFGGASVSMIGATIAQLVGGGVCERFPDLHFLFIESGASWVAFLMQCLDNSWEVGLGSRDIQRASEIAPTLNEVVSTQSRWDLPLRPSEYIKRQMHFSFMEDHAALQNRHITGIEPLVWGNDYPHYEGSWPKSHDAIELMCTKAGLTDDERAAIFGGTIAKLHRMELPVPV